MAVATPTIASAQGRVAPKRRRKFLGPLLVNGSLALICILWTIPTLGLLISSFRTPQDIANTGWWTIFPHTEYTKVVGHIQLDPNTPLNQPFQVAGATVTNDKLLKGYVLPNGQQAKWEGAPRLRNVALFEKAWVSNTNFTLKN